MLIGHKTSHCSVTKCAITNERVSEVNIYIKCYSVYGPLSEINSDWLIDNCPVLVWVSSMAY